MKHLLTLSIILLTISQGFAQNKDVTKVYIKWIPTSLLDPFAQSVQFSVEQRLNGRHSLQYGLGYITGSERNFFSNPATGYRSRFGFRMYRNGLRPTSFSFFHGPSVIARQTFGEHERTICLTSNCASSIDVHYVEMRTRVALTYGYGWHLTSKENMSLELEILQGIAYRKTTELGLPPIALLDNTSGFPTFLFSNGDGFRPAIHILLKVGFGVRSKE